MPAPAVAQMMSKSILPAPKTIPNMTCWFDASRLNLADAQSVDQWDDVSGNGYALTPQYTPYFAASIVNGKPAVIMESSAMGYTFPNGALVTFFMVWRGIDPLTARKNVLELGLTGSSTQFGTLSSFGPGMYFRHTAGLGELSNVTTLDVTTWQTLVVKWTSAASMSVYVNGGTPVTFDPYEAQSGTLRLNGYNIGDFQTYMGVADIIAYSTVLTNTQINTVGSYLATKYALSWTNV